MGGNRCHCFLAGSITNVKKVLASIIPHREAIAPPVKTGPMKREAAGRKQKARLPQQTGLDPRSGCQDYR
jgi:hypothetical protein